MEVSFANPTMLRKTRLNFISCQRDVEDSHGIDVDSAHCRIQALQRLDPERPVRLLDWKWMK